MLRNKAPDLQTLYGDSRRLDPYQRRVPIKTMACFLCAEITISVEHARTSVCFQSRISELQTHHIHTRLHTGKDILEADAGENIPNPI